MKILRLPLFFFFLTVIQPGICQEKSLDNVFYCFNNGMRGLPNAPESYEGQAALLNKLGYDGLAGHATQDNLALRDALDQAGLLMPEVYYGLTLDENGEIDVPEGLLEIVKASKNRDLLVALTLNANKHLDKKEDTDKLFVAEIRRLAEFAAGYNVDIAIYPHVDCHCEEIIHSVDLANRINKENVGTIFNTCHLLKVEGEKGWKKKAIKALPYLKMVSLNGADSGDTQNMGWDQLIQPLGEGSFDTYELVKFLKDRGFNGKFGLQCYNIPLDCETALSISMNTWKSYQKKYASE